MAELHHHATLQPSKLEAVSAWIGSQRWYGAKGRLPQLRVVDAFRFGDPDGAVGIETLLVEDLASGLPVLYQVPLTYRGAALPGAEPALVGMIEHSVLGTRYVYDGPHDPVYARELLRFVHGDSVAESSGQSNAIEPRYVGAPQPGIPSMPTVEASQVLTGEQSNSSIIYDTIDSAGAHRPLICKVFRTLQAGDNPDVVLQGALAAAGSSRVPSVIGAVSGQWPVGEGKPAAQGHLAFAQEFLPGTEDAWRVALRAAGAQEDFTAAARGLGQATAEVHLTLAQHLPTQAATPALVGEILDGMRVRLAAAIEAAPDLAPYADRIEAVYREAASARWPVMQRIHGDYHLGQVLHSSERGWILLDFEGEPLRPLAERVLPDCPVRDLAGMLRSLDYAGGSVEHSDPEMSAREWVLNGQQAFLDGYAAQGGADPRLTPELLTAFTLDKALYEVVYEARNRPTWLDIPLDAIARLLAAISREA